MANIEYVEGTETHSSYWGKFYVKGLETWRVKEDFDENQRDKHHSYQGYACNDIPETTVFSVFYQDGNKRGTDVYRFYICVAYNDVTETINVPYGSGKIVGNFRIIVQGLTKTLAPRLMDWWNNSPYEKSVELAEHCAANINKRGLKNLPPMNTLD